MKKRRTVGIRSRLNRIERKCDLILSHILVADRSKIDRKNKMDNLLDRLHSAACRLREQTEREKERMQRMFGDSPHHDEH